ncbi:MULTISPECIES: hypothetical protein [unclassified Streptomyces]|uniref:hypothetical protein n=1 Tax=unclassified Streptomyces TaxID=2593676 RepID=UPI0036E4BD26
MSVHGSTRTRSGSGIVSLTPRGSRTALLDGAKAVLAVALVLGAATACGPSSSSGSDKVREWKVGDCAGPDQSESKDGYQALDCDDDKATIKALEIKSGAIFSDSIQCPAGTDTIISVKVSYGGKASSGIPTKTICGRNLSGDHPGDAGAGGGQLVKGDCVDDNAKEVPCGSGGSGVNKVLDLTKTVEECPAGTDNPLELFPSPGRPYNAICTTKS